MKLLFFALLISVVLGGLLMIGPGVQDYSKEIVGGYYFVSNGGRERHIFFMDDKGISNVVIDSRVDNYLVDGSMLLVARTPRELFYENGVMKSKFSEECEYIVVDTLRHSLQVVPYLGAVSCKKGVRSSQ